MSTEKGILSTMTSPEEAFFVYCKFCQTYEKTSTVRDLVFVDDFVKFTCTICNYRSESMMYAKDQISGFVNVDDFGTAME